MIHWDLIADPWLWETAREIGWKRHTEDRRNKVANQLKIGDVPVQGQLFYDSTGALGEILVGLSRGIDWDRLRYWMMHQTIDKMRNQPDIPPDIQVRTSSSQKDMGLRIRQQDITGKKQSFAKHRWFHVYVPQRFTDSWELSGTATIVGWMYGQEAVDTGTWKPLRREGTGALYVPPEKLNDPLPYLRHLWVQSIPEQDIPQQRKWPVEELLDMAEEEGF